MNNESLILRRKKQIEKDRFFYVNSEYKTVQIKLDDILYVMGQKDYIKIYIKGKAKPVMCLMNMSTLEEYLPSPEFLRIHRSYLIHIKEVTMFDRSRARFGDTFIPISDSYKGTIQDYIEEHSMM